VSTTNGNKRGTIVQQGASRRVAIIGGGISGLSAAHQLQQLDPSLDWQLFEAGNQLGGVLHTERCDGYLIEHSADMFTTQQPWGTELCEQLELAPQLIPTDDRYRRAFVVRRGKLHPVPLGFSLLQPQRLGSILTTPLLSWPGKIRLLAEYLQPPRQDTSDESLAEFAIRRFGREAFQRLIQPLVGGIYTADPDRLSMQATLGRFLEMEREHGGLIRATLAGRKRQDPQTKVERQASGARYSLFVAPRDGIGSLIDQLAKHLPATRVRTGCRVESIVLDSDHRWQLRLQSHESPVPETHSFQGLIVATPASQAARLLAPVDAQLAAGLDSIPLAGAAIVIASFRRDRIRHPLDGFGFVVPLVEKRKILSASFASVKFPGRAPPGEVLVRIFVGGACQPELLENSDEEIERFALQDLADLLGISGPPQFAFVRRWDGTMPQYHLGHVQRVEEIQRRVAALPGLQLAGNAYHGVGIPFCIRSGQRAAQLLLSHNPAPATCPDSP
jgi:protoporphyrinogen/coproporphyrinogen III oxidase